tara:strand:+ start:128 stop:469 length:342 start_codon:yes stop_codon:yes gene_type:complete
MAKQLDENHSLGVDLDGDGKSDFNISLKVIGILIMGIISMAGMWFTLKADIAKAMELPEPVVSAVEFNYKDKMIRQTIELTQKDVETIKNDVETIKSTLEKLDERLYELQKQR